nr:MAG TPA: hypothetical protein [Caudoviricetes sp.]
MNEVLLVAVIALAIALMSIVINLMLVFKISNLKNHVEWIENAPIDSLRIRDNVTNDKLTKLGEDTKDAFDIVTNNLKLHGTLLEELTTKFALLDGRVSKHHKQLDELGKFAGITTGELRVLEQKIYNVSKNEPEYMLNWVSDAEKKLIEIDRIKESIENKQSAIEESRNRVDIKKRVSILEKKLEDNLKRDSEMEESVSLCHEHTNVNNNQLNRLGERLSVVEIKLAKAFEEFNHDLKTIQSSIVLMQKDVLTRYNELSWKLKGVCPEELNYDIRKKKPDRRRKDNYYRRPNQVSVGDIKEFEGDVFK